MLHRWRRVSTFRHDGKVMPLYKVRALVGDETNLVNEAQLRSHHDDQVDGVTTMSENAQIQRLYNYRNRMESANKCFSAH